MVIKPAKPPTSRRTPQHHPFTRVYFKASPSDVEEVAVLPPTPSLVSPRPGDSGSAIVGGKGTYPQSVGDRRVGKPAHIMTMGQNDIHVTLGGFWYVFIFIFILFFLIGYRTTFIKPWPVCIYPPPPVLITTLI